MRSILAGAVLTVGVVCTGCPGACAKRIVSGRRPSAAGRVETGRSAGEKGPVRPGVQDPVQTPVAPDDDEDNNGRDSLKNGTLTGLVIGGIIGALFAAECGHPECGPYISFFAGIGAAVGVGIDAMLTNRTLVPVETRKKPRLAPFDRAIKVGVTKRW